MSWNLPTPLLLVAGAIALWPPAVHRAPADLTAAAAGRAFATTLAVITLVWFGWIASGCLSSVGKAVCRIGRP